MKREEKLIEKVKAEKVDNVYNVPDHFRCANFDPAWYRFPPDISLFWTLTSISGLDTSWQRRRRVPKARFVGAGPSCLGVSGAS